MRIRRVVTALSVLSLVGAGVAASSIPDAGAAGSHVCSGSPKSPGHLHGTFGDVTVKGACAVDSGAAHVRNITVSSGSVLVAAFGQHHSSLSVSGDVSVASGGTAIIGCLPSSFPCIDDPSQNHPTLSSHAHVGLNILARGALGVLVHNSDVGHDVIETSGGGGFNCNPQGIFNLFQSPVFSAFEDMTVGGNIRIFNVRSCWAGIARANVTGDITVSNDKYNDPDAMEIVLNHVHGNLSCSGISMTWDSGDIGNGLYPRAPQPNTVNGRRSGQCVLNSPTSPKDKPGPGAF